MPVAAIDIGSNAIRLTISKKPRDCGYHVVDDLIIKHRFPCRLGNDVFKSQTISSEKEQQLHYIFKEMRGILNEHKVKKVNTAATSAFRDASNGIELLKTLSDKYEIPCKIITGKDEASFMSQGLLRRGFFKSGQGHLHADIGGGSLELSLFHKKEFVFQESLDVGTLRLLVDTRTGQLIPNHSRQLDLIDKVLNNSEVLKIAQSYDSENLIMHGTGGNFRRLGRLRKHTLQKRKDTYLRFEEIASLLGAYLNYSGYELSKYAPVKEDNAALIVPSLLIIQRVLNFWPASIIEIPKVSLSHTLLDEFA